MRCAACHGATGIEGPASRLAGTDGFIGWSDPLRPLRVRKYPLQVLSVGALWPHATTVFDYVRRAMPMNAPKSLTDDEVYAITGYVLHLNGLVDAGDVFNRDAAECGLELPDRVNRDFGNVEDNAMSGELRQ